MSNQGTESLIELANELEAVAPNVEAWFDHTRAAALMRKAAAELRRLAPLDPDIDVVHTKNTSIALRRNGFAQSLSKKVCRF